LTVKCSNCGEDVPAAARHCVVCDFDVGYPNVRLAERPEEVAALVSRAAAARTTANARDIESELIAFAKSVQISKAVTNKSLGALHSWLTDANPLMITFHQQVRAKLRIPEENIWDQQRASAENTVNPNFYEHISFGALTLDHFGLTHYGPYSISLKEDLITRRTSVFEENPFLFCQRHAIISGQPIPIGYRTVWSNRQELAVAKLESKVQKGQGLTAFTNILMEPRRDDPNCDFIEVHIFGTIHKAVIEHVAGPMPREDADRALWKKVKRQLNGLGATWEEI
jgi:hypothetical protein